MIFPLYQCCRFLIYNPLALTSQYIFHNYHKVFDPFSQIYFFSKTILKVTITFHKFTLAPRKTSPLPKAPISPVSLSVTLLYTGVLEHVRSIWACFLTLWACSYHLSINQITISTELQQYVHTCVIMLSHVYDM